MTKLFKIELYMLIVSVTVYVSCLIISCFTKWLYLYKHLKNVYKIDTILKNINIILNCF